MVAIAVSLAMISTAFGQSAASDRRGGLTYSVDSDGLGTLLKRSVENTLLDQRPIWTSPFHMTGADAKWWALFGGGTGVFIAYDRRLSNEISSEGFPRTFGTVMSPLGEYWALYPAALAFAMAGKHQHNQKAFETGGLLVQALTDSAIVAGALKLAGRERPNEGDGGGHFLKGDYSFPSAHAIGSWTFASVVAHRYRNKKAVPILAYTMATAVSVSRVTGRDHFASDVLAGGTMGFFIGRFVVHTRESRDATSQARRSSSLMPNVSPILGHGGLGLSLRWGLNSGGE
jgi:membrane-associated phospholipid phosphatase